MVYPVHPLCEFNYEPYVFELTTGKVISAIAMALLIVTALAGNILLCTAFFFYRRLRKTTNYFIISLAVSDLLVASISMPMWLSYDVTGWMNLPDWINFKKLWQFWSWFDILSGVSSITNLTAISIDRFFSIMAPLLHRTRMTSSVAMFMIIVAWIYGIVLASLFLVGLPYYSVIVATAGFFLPLSVIVVAYITIYLKVKHGFLSKHTVRDWNLERTLLIVICVFVICWMPFFIFTLLYHHCEKCDFSDQNKLQHLVSFIKWMHYLNSCCNPFIYGVFNTNFKLAFKSLLRQCCRSSTFDGELTNMSSEVRESSIRHQIRSLGRKLNYKRRGNKDSLLLSDIESTSVSILPGSLSNRNSNVLNNNPRGSSLFDKIDEAGEQSSTTDQIKQNGIVRCDVRDEAARSEHAVAELALENQNRSINRDSPVLATKENSSVNGDSPVLARQNSSVNRDFPVLATKENSSVNRDSPVLARHNTYMNRDSPVLAKQNSSVNRDSPVLARHNTYMNRDSPVLAKQNSSVNLDSPVLTMKNNSLNRFSPTIEQQNSSVHQELAPEKVDFCSTFETQNLHLLSSQESCV